MFRLRLEALTVVDEAGQRLAEPGTFLITAGGASPGARAVACGAPDPVEVTLSCHA